MTTSTVTRLPLPERICTCTHERAWHLFSAVCRTDECPCLRFEDAFADTVPNPRQLVEHAHMLLSIRDDWPRTCVAIRAAYAFGDWPPAVTR